MADAKANFLAYCDAVKKGSNRATDKTLKRICTDCKIYCKGLDANSVDIEFRGHLLKAKDVDYEGFIKFVDGRLSKAYAKAKSMDQGAAAEEIKKKVADHAPVLHGATASSGDGATKRLTDVKGYTGAHKERFDAESGKGKGIEGREYVVDKKAAEGYVGGYNEMDTYDKAKK